MAKNSASRRARTAVTGRMTAKRSGSRAEKFKKKVDAWDRRVDKSIAKLQHARNGRSS